MLLADLASLFGGEGDLEELAEAAGGAGIVKATGTADAERFASMGGNDRLKGILQALFEFGACAVDPTRWWIEPSESRLSGRRQREVNPAPILLVDALCKEPLRFEHVQALRHVSLRQAKKRTNGQGIVAEGIGPRKVPESYHVNGFKPFERRSSADFATQKSGEPLDKVQGIGGRHFCIVSSQYYLDKKHRR
jgi:hypothetical protein